MSRRPRVLGNSHSSRFSNPECIHQAYYLLDELIIAGELQESSKKAVLRVCAAQDALMEENKDAERDD